MPLMALVSLTVSFAARAEESPSGTDFLSPPLAEMAAEAGGGEAGKTADPDPLEKFNRFVFKVNDSLDSYLLVPIARGYRNITPRPVRRGALNFSRNVVNLNTTGYQVLQGKPGKAGVTLARFLINSTLGFGGLFDPASDMGLPAYSEDLGQTLGSWGVGPGPYLVIPFLGPSTMRDASARLVDVFVNAQSTLDIEDQWAFFILDTLAFRESLLGATELFSGDKYTAFRNAYLSRRQWQVTDGRSGGDEESEEDLQELFDDEEFFDDFLEDVEPNEDGGMRAPPPLPVDRERHYWYAGFPYPVQLYNHERRHLALLRQTRALSRWSEQIGLPPNTADIVDLGSD